MDLIVKLTIGLFIFSILLLFFKATKKMSKNYLEDHIANQVDVDEILSRYDDKRIQQENKQSFDIPINHLSSMNPDDIVWKVNN